MIGRSPCLILDHVVGKHIEILVVQEYAVHTYRGFRFKSKLVTVFSKLWHVILFLGAMFIFIFYFYHKRPGYQ